ncbi:unnamed protein product [Durusdinium trenchii]|uniref:RNA ligase domain-containing protein n=1 Tax=Durusdinium trenchii TaxID=1381693 RepID=A0ABP0P266_9DINO
MPKPVYATADELADAVKKLEGQAASELAAATRSSRRLRRSHQCTGMIGMIGLSGEGGLTTISTPPAFRSHGWVGPWEDHEVLRDHLEGRSPEGAVESGECWEKPGVIAEESHSDGLGDPRPTTWRTENPLRTIAHVQANDQMASNASTATEGIARCGSDSKTYTDDRQVSARDVDDGDFKAPWMVLPVLCRKALADELAALCERIDKEFLTTREDARRQAPTPPPGPGGNRFSGGQQVSGFGPGRLRGLRGLIDAMKMDVAGKGKANLSDQRSQLDTAMAEAAKEVEQKLDQLQAAMEKTLKDGRKPRSRGRIGGHTDMPYGDFNEEQGKAQGLRDEKQQRAESEIWLKLDRTSELLQEPWAVLQDVLQGVLQLGDETNQNLEDYKTEAIGSSKMPPSDCATWAPRAELRRVCTPAGGEAQGPTDPTADLGRERERAVLANEEEAADGGQSAFMFSPKFDMAGVHGLQLELQLFSERRMESFVGYGKIAHGTCKGPEESEWCVTEKVHGANFSVHVDRAGRMKCAKRKGFLEEEEDFFGHFSMLTRLRTPLLALAREVLESSGADYVALFGELCGGKYPHTEVREVPFARPVQVGVWYSPCIEFILFDIAVFTGPRSHFMAFKSVADLAKKHALHTVPLLFVGSRGECANYDPKFLSRVPEMLGLPRLSSENWAEGIVAKIWDQTSPMERRPIFKIKIQEFQEGEGSAPSTGDPSMKTYLLSQVNENRILSAASKVGPADDAGHWEEITDLVIQDIRDDVGDDPTFLALEDQLRCATYDMLAEAIPSS